MKYCKSCQKKVSYRHTFCTVKCQCEYYYTEFIRKWLSGETLGSGKDHDLSRHVYRWLRETRGVSCELCGWAEINPVTKKVPTEIDHIDGNHANNRPENLRVLCPNCHSLTSTYKALNKGNGRPRRKSQDVG